LHSSTHPALHIDSRRIRWSKLWLMEESDKILARKLTAIADPTRRRILQALKERGGCSIGKDVGLCASDIELRVHLSQPTISHHMAVLRRAGLVEVTKVGQWMWFRRNESALHHLIASLRDSL